MIKRSVTMVKGLLAHVAAGLGQAAKQESTEAAGRLIERLGNALPF